MGQKLWIRAEFIEFPEMLTGFASVEITKLVDPHDLKPGKLCRLGGRSNGSPNQYNRPRGDFGPICGPVRFRGWLHRWCGLLVSSARKHSSPILPCLR